MTDQLLFSNDWDDLLSALIRHKVRFVIVGGHAVSAHGATRYTEDLDVFVDSTESNAKLLLKALSDFFSEDVGFTLEQFSVPNKVTMIGNKPFRVDILTSIDGLEFEEVFSDAERYGMGTNLVPVISKNHLLINKKASARDKDLLDISALNKIT